MAKASIAFLASLFFSVCCMTACTSKNTEHNSLMVDSSQFRQPIKRTDKMDFVGEYISPNPGKIDKGSYYTGLIITADNHSDSLNVQFSSAKIKRSICCSFSGNGFLQHDTLFVPLQISGYTNAIMIVTQNTNDSAADGSIVVATLNSTQANALMNFCCTGASLSGNYFPCDLSLFRTDTTMANANTNYLLR